MFLYWFRQESKLAYAASIYFDKAYYIFGGRSSATDNSKDIGRLDAVKRTWSLAGSLVQGRNGHGVIFDGRQLLVIGGYKGTYKTEVCDIIEETVTCTQQQNGLFNYEIYPELFLVDEDYGNDC